MSQHWTISKMFGSTIVSVVFLLCVSNSFGQDSATIFRTEKEILDKILDPTRYDSRIRAHTLINATDPVVVNTNMYIRQIEYVCTRKMQFKVQITFRQQWNDQRLEFDDRNGKIQYLVLTDADKIWTPDTFFSNSMTSEKHGALKPNLLMRIYPDGNVLFSNRLTLTLSCPMDLKHYPFGSDICSLQIASYGYTTDDLILTWKEGDPTQVTKMLMLKNLKLESYGNTYCTSRTNTGEYSCLKLDLKFKRVISKNTREIFIQTFVITMASFASFWLRREGSVRIITLVVSIILLYLTVSKSNNQLSAVNYSTAMDCWNNSCLLFVLGAFLEYGIVVSIERSRKCQNTSQSKNECKKSNGNHCEEGDAVALKPLVEDGNEGQTEEGGKQYTVSDDSKHRSYGQKWKRAPIGCRIDSVVGILFPILFILYVIIYLTFEIQFINDKELSGDHIREYYNKY